MRGAPLLAIVLVGCASSPAPAPSGACPPASSARQGALGPASGWTGEGAPASGKSARPCLKRSAGANELMEGMLSALDPQDRGSLKMEQSQLVRWFPSLSERGAVRSIVATRARAEHGPVFALTLLIREASGGLDAHLAFAAPACAEGDLVLLGEPVPLGAPEAVIEWVSPVPIAPPLTELKISVGDAPNAWMGPERGRRRMRDVIVNSSLVASFELEDELPPEDGVRRRDEMMIGTGWYALDDGGAALLSIHRAVDDREDLCRRKAKVRPFRAPELRVLGRVDARGALVGAARRDGGSGAEVGPAFVIVVPENQPPATMASDARHTLRSGSFEAPSAQWFYGLYASAEAARAHAAQLGYRGGQIVAVSPPSKLDVKPDPGRLRIECNRY